MLGCQFAIIFVKGDSIYPYGSRRMENFREDTSQN